MPNNQPVVSASIAIGNVDSTGASAGDKLQGSQGGVCVKGATAGSVQLTLSAPNDGLAGADLVVKHNPGFGTSKSGGGMTTTMSSYSAGVILFQLWDQTTVPPVAIEGNIHFEVSRMLPVR